MENAFTNPYEEMNAAVAYTEDDLKELAKRYHHDPIIKQFRKRLSDILVFATPSVIREQGVLGETSYNLPKQLQEHYDLIEAQVKEYIQATYSRLFI